jgi:pyruvate formate lyase activating enzyme
MKCVDACKYNALTIVGQEYSIAEVLEDVQKDEPFYVNSGGGMTISGGEPLTSPEFVGELLARAKAKGLHTCLDTSGHCPWEVLEPILKNVDLVLYDLKHIDSAEHKKMTGVGNELILENLKKISENGQAIWVRIPVIPDYNDQLDYHLRVVDFLKSLSKPVERVDLLPFHNWCQDKYRWLGKDWVYTGMEAMEPSFLNPLLDIYREAGIQATIGGSGFEGRE